MRKLIHITIIALKGEEFSTTAALELVLRSHDEVVYVLSSSVPKVMPQIICSTQKLYPCLIEFQLFTRSNFYLSFSMNLSFIWIKNKFQENIKFFISIFSNQNIKVESRKSKFVKRFLSRTVSSWYMRCCCGK